MKRTILTLVLTAALSLGGVPLAVAHPGHAHKVLGTVTAIQGNTLEVKDPKGAVSKHVLGPTTKIRRDKTTLRVADIKVGDRVVITSSESKDKAGKAVVTVTDVQVGVQPVAAAQKQ